MLPNVFKDKEDNYLLLKLNVKSSITSFSGMNALGPLVKGRGIRIPFSC